jgi:hypothetical protein
MDQPWTVKTGGDFTEALVTEGGWMIVPIPRPEAIAGLEPSRCVREDGTTYEIELPALRKAALQAEDIATITSQKTSRFPRRTITSSSFPPARTFESRTR